MKHLMLLAALSISLVGCKKKSSADCDAALNHSMELAKGHSMAGLDDKTITKLKDLGIQHCKEDKWPDDVLKCMTDAKSEADGQACYGKLTPEQQKKMNEAAMGATAPAATPPPATGSDMGSAPAAPAGTGSAS